MSERRLGRGLDSLIARTTESRGRQVLEVPVDSVVPNPDQPRQVLHEASLEGLAQSIRQHGVMQPIIVQKITDGYQLVAGERRLRASRLAEKATIPALVVDVQGTKSLELALIENVQRENLGPLDEAAAFDALITRAGLTHQALAERVGKSRAAITNTLRLLELPDAVKKLIHSGALSAGQARAVMSAGSPEQVQALAQAAYRDGLSVREVERRAQKTATRTRRRRAGDGARTRGSLTDYEEQLRHIYGTKAAITGNAGRGEIRLTFYSDADRDRLLHLLITGGAAAVESGGI